MFLWPKQVTWSNGQWGKEVHSRSPTYWKGLQATRQLMEMYNPLTITEYHHGAQITPSSSQNLLLCAMLSTGVFGKTKNLPAKDLASQLSPLRLYHLPGALPSPSLSRDSHNSPVQLSPLSPLLWNFEPLVYNAFKILPRDFKILPRAWTLSSSYLLLY